MGRVHTTNYANTLILPAEDCKAKVAQTNPKAGTVGAILYEMLLDAPYSMTGDDLLVAVTGLRKGIPQDEWPDLRAEIFSKGQPCLRASPLVKTMGWAVHHNASQHVGLVEVNSPEFQGLVEDETVTKTFGMRNKRA